MAAFSRAASLGKGLQADSIVKFPVGQIDRALRPYMIIGPRRPDHGNPTTHLSSYRQAAPESDAIGVVRDHRG
jgi:hypothetical protein